MNKPFRSHTCAQLTHDLLDKELRLAGWIHRIRNHGGVCFIQLRDRYSTVQLVINEESPKALVQSIAQLHPEYCISVVGILRHRPDTMINPELRNGAYEVHLKTLDVLTTSPALPFTVEPTVALASEDLRLTHRYLDLRSGDMQQALLLRHLVSQAIRSYLSDRDFIEIETPTLIRSTPEGARDFLVPSRQQQGTFYALPQSPQLYKQILMVSGMDKYFQLAHCYRDEDARGDRQPEHTQLDLEMSFVTQEDIFALSEKMIAEIFTALNTSERLSQNSYDTQLPQFILANASFRRMTYDEAMTHYGTDKPDLRISYVIRDFSHLAVRSGVPFFEDIQHGVESPDRVLLLRIPQGARLSRKHLDSLASTARNLGAAAFAWTKIKDGGFEGGIATKLQLNPQDIIHEFELDNDDLLLFAKGSNVDYAVYKALGGIRLLAYELMHTVSDRLTFESVSGVVSGAGSESVSGAGSESVSGAAPKAQKTFEFVWVTDFPLFERVIQDKDKTTDSKNATNTAQHDAPPHDTAQHDAPPHETTWTPAHHMFTQPQQEHLDFLTQNIHPVKDYDYSKLRGVLYDLVCNGVELASGSIRIHDSNLQKKIFDIVGVSPQEQESRFGFLLRALQYGAPPHGGIAPGIDRFIALLLGRESIRDVMAFPKNSFGASPMDGSPGEVAHSQLEELGIKIVRNPAEQEAKQKPAE